MSFDVYLCGPSETVPCVCPCGHAHTKIERTVLFEANITHNLNRMAGEAGIYRAVWCPDEIGITTAAQLIEPLTSGIALLESDPERFRQFDPSNGWGSYQAFIPWLEAYLEACQAHPDASVEVSR